jgi:threonine/homoserine/homoserine lactone efflux protein
MFTLLYKGLLIGLVSSIPVGPIAVLCIQRTLNRGKYHGWVTGVGAALSDLMYASLAAFSLSFVVDLIENNQFLIEILGAIIIFIFGFVLFRSNPTKRLASKAVKKESYVQDFATAFALTVTNPLIIFLFITLFAQFNFVDQQYSAWQVAIGLLCVFIGASLWWFALTSFVNVFRSCIDVRRLGLINKIAGGIMMGLAVIGLLISVAHHISAYLATVPVVH